MGRLKIFISSTIEDLQPERDAVEKAISTFRFETVRAETIGAQPLSSREACLEMARECDIYIGIYGGRYGWIPPGDEVSVTEMEFLEVQEQGKDILIYVKEVEREERQQEFIHRVEDFDEGYFRRPYFTSPEQVAEWVMEDLAALVSRRYAKVALENRVEGVVSRLAELSLVDEGREGFGENKFTSGMASLDSRYAIIVAMPLNRVAGSSTSVLQAASSMLQPDNWYSPTPDNHPPRYWPHSIFDIPTSRRSDRNAFVWEDVDRNTQDVRSRLVITGAAEVIFVSSTRFVTKLRNGIGVFKLGRILAECWMLAGVVAQLYHDIGHHGRTHLCIGMVGTKGTHLGYFADDYREPFEERYWFDYHVAERNWTCSAPNLRFCETVDLMGMQPKEQPGFVESFAVAISLAYNHDEARCFDAKTGLLPARYFRNG